MQVPGAPQLPRGPGGDGQDALHPGRLAVPGAPPLQPTPGDPLPHRRTHRQVPTGKSHALVKT